jgi:hypothetical protein
MTVRALVVLVLLVGCGGGSDKERRVCDHAAKLCDAMDERAACVKDIGKSRELMGASYDKFLDCSLQAKSCGAYVGCAIGGVGAEGKRQIQDLGEGMRKMMEDELEKPGRPTETTETRRTSDEDGVPPECKRVDDVCSGFEARTTAKHCAEMIGNIKADTENRKKLAGCFAQAKNCFTFDKCIDDLWFELH